jgi:iron complex transport system substrate-binding protein
MMDVKVDVKKMRGAPVCSLAAMFFLIAAMGCAVQKTPETSRSETYEFTDSCGRKVELPRNIERVVPSGPLAQIVLFTLCPDKLAGFGIDFSDRQFEYIDRKYASLPVLGNFYGDTLNLESLMVTDPQIVIDVGEPMKKIREDMDGIQKKTGIPTIFVKMDMDSMVSAYRTLGEVVGETGQAQKMIDYIEKTFAETRQKLELIPADGRVKVYYGQEDGLKAVVKGTVHADVIDIAGGLNVSEVEESIRGGASEISMEQLMLWNPDVVLFAPNSIYDSVENRAEWKEISAIKNKKYYEVPNGPYNWIGRPPSVNRVLGVKWLTNLLYPGAFQYDMVKETREFYRLFYHCDVTDEQIGALLSRSTYRE